MATVNTVERLLGRASQGRRTVNVWITIPEVVKILGKKTHQVRPLIWDGELGEARKEGRRVIVRKSAVLAYQKAHPGKSQAQAGPRELAQEVVLACDLVSKLFAENVAAVGGKEFVAKVQAGLARFVADAKELVS